MEAYKYEYRAGGDLQGGAAAAEEALSQVPQASQGEMESCWNIQVGLTSAIALNLSSACANRLHMSVVRRPEPLIAHRNHADGGLCLGPIPREVYTLPEKPLCHT